jgi:Interferon-induced 6-16 family
MFWSGLPHQEGDGEISPLVEGRVARPALVQQLIRMCCLLFVVVVGLLSIAQLLACHDPQESRINLDEFQRDADGNLDGSDVTPNDASDSCQTMTKTVVVGCGVVIGTAIAVPAATIIAGFGAGGVVAGSVAAAWQATIGSVAACSLFAWLQAVGATSVVAAGGAISAGWAPKQGTRLT